VTEKTYQRRSARVLLLDDAGRILLLRSLVDPTDAGLGHCWLTPGGGVDGGESLPRAAARELHEEIGLVVNPHDLGDPVAHTAGYADLGWTVGTFRDDFFYHRVVAHEVDTSRMEARERRAHAGHRWWTVDELASTTDPVYPFELAPLMTDLLANSRPQRPVRLPWHH
jgi:8-oxo-dGTP pyrophosphatase MutT (NUDIX family)